MPGAGAHRWQWIAKPPLYWTILLVLMMGHLAVSLLLFFTLSRWAQSLPDASHAIELRMRGGRSYYWSPALGRYLNGHLWFTLGLPGALALIMMIHRNKVERVQ